MKWANLLAIPLILILGVILKGCAWRDTVIDPYSQVISSPKILGAGYVHKISPRDNLYYVEINTVFYGVTEIYKLADDSPTFIKMEPIEDTLVTVVEFSKVNSLIGEGVKCLLGVWDAKNIETVFLSD